MSGSMGRKRTGNFSLPPRMHLKSGTYYYVTSTKPRKWISLGKDIGDAKKEWARLESDTGTTGNLAPLIDEYLSSDKFMSLAKNTQTQYKSVANQLKIRFEDFNVEDIRPKHIAAWQDAHHSKINANTGKSILASVLKIAIRRGLIDRNPASEISRINIKPRGRYITDEEYLAIKSHADPVLKAVMDLSYVTSSRISDVLAIRLSNITEDGMLVRQIKTKKLQLFQHNAALDKAIENAKAIDRPFRGLYLLCTMRGKPYSYNQLNLMWLDAREKAGVLDVHFHDIRGKSATDAKRDGMDYQALLGHATKAMSDRYIKIEDAQSIEPMRKIL